MKWIRWDDRENYIIKEVENATYQDILKIERKDLFYKTFEKPSSWIDVFTEWIWHKEAGNFLESAILASLGHKKEKEYVDKIINQFIEETARELVEELWEEVDDDWKEEEE